MEGWQSNCYPRLDTIIAHGAEQGLGKYVLFYAVSLWSNHIRFTAFHEVKYFKIAHSWTNQKLG